MSAFAVASIRCWSQARGCLDYPHATRLLITADAGGSNSYRYRVWKSELAAFASETGLVITLCHFPLTRHEVVAKTIAATRTRTGVRVQVELDTGAYPTGIGVSKERLDPLSIERHEVRGIWNYTIHPAGESATGAAARTGT